MQTTFICKHCGEEKPANPRLKGNQKFCSDAACQRARKADWHTRAMATDALYRAQQLDCLKQWRKHRPLDHYQRQYRQKHPEYVEDNRKKQRIRNQKRRKTQEIIVKIDALDRLKSDTYLMTPFTMDASGKIVKMDTLLVELKSLQLVQGNSIVSTR